MSESATFAIGLAYAMASPVSSLRECLKQLAVLTGDLCLSTERLRCSLAVGDALLTHMPSLSWSRTADQCSWPAIGTERYQTSGGDASYTIPFIKMSSEGTYICSVLVNPLFASLDINLRIEEPPRVSVNIGSALSLQEGGEQKIVCEAENYYPLDVEIVWYEQDPAVSGQRVGAPLPKVLQNILLSSHKHNQDKTYSLSAFFYLRASLRDSGRQFTCSVSHQSLRVPIKKSFILTVEEPSSWLFNLTVGVIVITLLVILYVMLQFLHSARQKSVQKKPY
ncbi:tapasin-related protein-like protein [Lates japonicus]|uniref:Tapasin-related protein-like protein n=1 Tax=Lates japonicus TaxID=270547 RepID=A0AAD3MF52_LATJO|nr:tapasin-related protein-like protein [Lates japonicus]